MTEKFYYFRDERGAPRVTVCLLKDEWGGIHRGISICSMKDNPIRKVGRNIARGRAQQAMISETRQGIVLRDEALNVLDRCNVPLVLAAGRKSVYNCATTPLETYILAERGKP